MVEFTVQLAGISIGVRANYPETLALCRDYFTQLPPAFSVTIEQDDLAKERLLYPKGASKTLVEKTALHRKISNALIPYDIVLFHGSAIAVDGAAYIFTAPSGTGKTTHTRLWLSQLPQAHVLNGDKPFLKVDEGRVLVCGTPWQGKENYGTNEILPLKAICVLTRDTENHIESLSYEAALAPLIQQTYKPRDTDLFLRTLQLIGVIGHSARLYHLGCNMEAEAAEVSRAAMLR